MVIAGALRHTKEVFGVLAELGQTKEICFYDDVIRFSAASLPKGTRC